MTPLVIVGASGRAAAQSARRAGLLPFVCDLFADTDTLRDSESVVRCPEEQFPHAIPELVSRFPPGPVLCVGGMENHPNVVEKLAESRELMGSPPAAMRLVRDPVAWPIRLRSAGLPAPENLAAARLGEMCGKSSLNEPRWLIKPARSAGGLGVRFFDPGADPAPPPDTYLQRFLAGRAMSGLFRAGSLVGIAEQFPGSESLHAATRFAYAAAVAPVRVADAVRDTVERVGRELASWACLRGLWGFDFILRDETVTPIEINPRYPATVELYERAGGCSLLAFDGRPPVRAESCAKGVYYAPRRLSFLRIGPWTDSTNYADIPGAGTIIEPGHPVLTLFAPTFGELEPMADELDRLWPEVSR